MLFSREKAKEMISKLTKSRAKIAKSSVAVFSCALVLGAAALPAICGASSVMEGDADMPWKDGIANIYDSLTGPIPKAVSVISIASGAGMYILGQNQISQAATRTVLGTGVITAAPSCYRWVTGDTNLDKNATGTLIE